MSSWSFWIDRSVITAGSVRIRSGRRAFWAASSSTDSCAAAGSWVVALTILGESACSVGLLKSALSSGYCSERRVRWTPDSLAGVTMVWLPAAVRVASDESLDRLVDLSMFDLVVRQSFSSLLIGFVA